MWERRAELEGFAAVMEGVRNAAERLKGRAIAGPHDYDQIPALAERSRLRVKDFYADLDSRLAEVNLEYLRCDGLGEYRRGNQCLDVDFVAVGSHFRLIRKQYADCGF